MELVCRAASHWDAAQSTKQPQMELVCRVRHVHGRPFIAHVHNADALTRHMVPDRLDVSTLLPT